MIGDPWYLESAGFSEIPDHVTGQNVMVTVVDSCIDFSAPYLNSSHIPSNDDVACEKELGLLLHSLTNPTHSYKIGGWKEYIHGTTIAGIIASKESTLKFNPLDDSIRYYKDKEIHEVIISGIAHDCKVMGIKHPITPFKVEKAIIENKIQTQEITNKGTNYFPKFERSEIVLVNLSGGQKATSADKEGWAQIIQQACHDKYTLVMAAVGNSGCNLNEEPSCGIYPAFAKTLKICQELNPILRVAASNQYIKGEQPELYSNSNYGNKHVDILVPGQNIPSLVPGGYATIASGTSQATAIVSGLAAILSSCNPYANADEIKESIIDGANSYNTLVNSVNDGKVINAISSFEALCFNLVSSESAYKNIAHKDEL